MLDDTQKEFTLWVIKSKYRALSDVDQALIEQLASPANNRVVIETQLNDDNIKRRRLLAKYDAIAAGEGFNFPSTAEVQALRMAVENLEVAVAQSAAVNTLLQAAVQVAGLVKASGLS